MANVWSRLKEAAASPGIRNKGAQAAVLIVGTLLAIAIRLPLLGFKSVDYFNERIQAYPLIQAQGFTALASSASNYNPPYFYLLFLIARLFPQMPMVVAVKLPAIAADFACALFVALIVKQKYGKGWRSLGAGLVALFAPTVVANSAFWGQVDSLHTAGMLACVYLLLKRRNMWAVLAFAIALAFKLQAIFLAPLLLALFLRGDISWKAFLVIPAILFAALIPAWIAGRPLLNLLTIYVQQAGQFELLTMNAPSIYAWVPGTKPFFESLYLPGLMAGAAAAFLLVALIYKGRAQMTPPLLLELALLTVLVVPYFLPKMHERYFYPADLLSIAFAFCLPQFFYVPMLVIGVSSLSYLPFLFNLDLVALPWLALVLLLVICVLAYHSIQQLYAPAEHAAPGSLDAMELTGEAA